MPFGAQNLLRAGRFTVAGIFMTAAAAAAASTGDNSAAVVEQDPRPLINAALRGEVAQVRREVMRGVNPSADNSRALSLACLRGHNAVVEVLVRDFGVNPNGKDSWPMAMAALGENIGTMKLLKSLGADVNGNNGWALGNAAVAAKAKSIIALLDDPELGADINAGQGLGLASAIRSKDPEIVKIFLDRKADPGLASVTEALREIPDNSTDENLVKIRTMVLEAMRKDAGEKSPAPTAPTPQ